jgi:RNA polymerase sigma factor (sigma-70 family)
MFAGFYNFASFMLVGRRGAMPEDEKLVRRFISGDERAFREIIEAYKGYVFAIILNLIKDNYMAEDIAQEVFLKIYRSLPDYHYKNFKSWVGKIAVNKAIDYKRAQARILSNEYTSEAMDEVLMGESGGQTPEEIFLDTEHRKRVLEVISSLPAAYSGTLEKYYFEGKSYKEIAVEECISTKTVESRLYRGKKLFEKSWGRDKP